MKRDPVYVLDIACNNLLACHLNLFLGILVSMVPWRRERDQLSRGLYSMDYLTPSFSEVGHGLNIQTIAIKVDDGSSLHTAHSSSARNKASLLIPVLCLTSDPGPCS